MNHRVLAYHKKECEKLDAKIMEKYPGCSGNHKKEINAYFYGASTRFGINRRSRLVRQLISHFPKYTFEFGKNPMRLDDALASLASQTAGDNAIFLSLLSARRTLRKVEDGMESVERKRTIKDPNVTWEVSLDAISTETTERSFVPTYKHVPVVEVGPRFSVKLLLAAVLACCLAYLPYIAGYPPPHRFIISSQKAEFGRFKGACRDNAVLKLSGHLHDSETPYLGDSLLSKSQRESRQKLLCAESLYRRYAGDFARFKQDNRDLFR